MFQNKYKQDHIFFGKRIFKIININIDKMQHKDYILSWN